MNNSNLRDGLRVIALTMVAGLISLATFMQVGCGKKQQPASGTAAAVEKVYIVERGDFLWKIADANGIDRQEMFLANERLLHEHWVEVRGRMQDRLEPALQRLSSSERLQVARLVAKPSSDWTAKEHNLLEKAGRKASYNFKSRPPYYGNPNNKKFGPANTLDAGMVLVIPPANDASKQVKDAVAQAPGPNIVLVVDSSGSMSDDRRDVARWYAQALRGSKDKRIAKVILYVDGGVRVYDGNLNLDEELTTNGGIENTRSAILRAAMFKPNSIIVVTDEPGDDWDGSESQWAKKMPPVFVHYLAPGDPSQLAAVVKASGGKFTRTLG